MFFPISSARFCIFT